jgi:hypothetical protein
MTHTDKRKTAKVVLGAALVVFMGASVGMSLEAEPFFTWYYLFAWWPFIVMLESAMFLARGYSMLYDRPREFAAMIPVSATFWLVFEAYNFRLDNWHYLNVPENLPLRWAGYFLSYGSVLPGLFVVKRLFEFMGLWEDAEDRPLKRPERLRKPLTVLGALCLVLPLIWPRYFFPLIWGGFIFLPEPWLSRYSKRSLLSKWADGSLRQLKLLLLAGLVCGGLWEMWNFWAGAKWYYTVPYVGFLKVFEMPILGFLGFPPFAVECFVMYSAWLLLKKRIDRLGGYRRTYAWVLLIGAAIVFDILIFAGIDAFTVASFGVAG